jgi:hypothetical protein
MKTYGGMDVWIHVFLTSALVGGEWSAQRPRRKSRITNWKGGWVRPRTGVDAVEKRIILHCWESNPGCSALGPSLYQLGFPGSLSVIIKSEISILKYPHQPFNIIYFGIHCFIF